MPSTTALTIADWCILLAGLVVPFIFTIYAKATKTFDNAKPREYMERLDGARKRAHWAVQNSYETFPLFVAAVLLAERASVAQSTVNMLAVAFVVARLVRQGDAAQFGVGRFDGVRGQSICVVSLIMRVVFFECFFERDC